jgi:cobalt-zinc-cadmium efflux system outer membrane protein
MFLIGSNRQRRRGSGLALIIVGLLSPSTWAADHWLLPDAVQYALSHQPDYIAAREDVVAAKARITQALARPNPQLTLTGQTLNPVDTGNTYFALDLQQSFDTSGQIGLKGVIAEQDAKIADLALAIARQALVKSVTEAYNRFLAAEETWRVARDNLTWQQRLLHLTLARIAAGEAAPPEKLRAQVAAALASRDEMAAAAGVAAARQALNVQIGREPTVPLEADDAFLPRVDRQLNPDALIKKAFEQRLEWRQLDINLIKALKGRSLIEKQIFPGFSGSLGASNNGPQPGANVVLAATLPIWYRQEGELAENASNERRLQAAKKGLVNAIRLQVFNAVRRVELAAQQIDIYQSSLLPDAKRLVDQTFERFRLGDVSSLELSEVRKTYRETRGAFVQAVLEYRNAKADLAVAVGSEEGR